MTISTHYRQLDADQMLSDADAALYAAKRGGRSQAQFFEPKRREPQSAPT
jgi:PleD family two-component response regulator